MCNDIMKMAFCMSVIIALVLYCYGYEMHAFSLICVTAGTYLLTKLYKVLYVPKKVKEHQYSAENEYVWNPLSAHSRSDDKMNFKVLVDSDKPSQKLLRTGDRNKSTSSAPKEHFYTAGCQCGPCKETTKQIAGALGNN